MFIQREESTPEPLERKVLGGPTSQLTYFYIRNILSVINRKALKAIKRWITRGIR